MTEGWRTQLTDQPLELALRATLAPVDAAWLSAFRIAFGLAMCVSMLRFIAFGWVDELFVQPRFHFKYLGFSWVEPLPGAQMHAFVWVMAGLALCVALGLCFRFAALAFALGFLYLQLIDVTTYLNHYYLANLLALLLAISPAGKHWALDSALLPRIRCDRVPAGVLYLFRFQVGVVYTFAGLAKAQSDWLLHAEPLSIWLGSKTDMPLLGGLFTLPGAAVAFSWAGFLFDTSVPWLLSFRRTRPYAYALVLVFHSLTSALFPIGMFPVLMVLSALVFFPPEWPRILLRAIARRLPRLATRGAFEPLALPSLQPVQARTRHALLACAAVAYCAVQVVMPLRHALYDGSVLWHEQGMRFSWRVMVREKNGNVTFIARDQQGRQWEIRPRRYLTSLQEREMSSQPDLILQLAHHIHEELERSHGPVAIHVEALVSLNGRRARLLIDPNIDLATIDDGVAPARWITASPGEAPPHIQPI